MLLSPAHRTIELIVMVPFLMYQAAIREQALEVTLNLIGIMGLAAAFAAISVSSAKYARLCVLFANLGCNVNCTTVKHKSQEPASKGESAENHLAPAGPARYGTEECGERCEHMQDHCAAVE